MEALNVELLKKAVGGEFAAIRRITRMEPIGEKIYPPTYEGGEYATELRQVRTDGEEVRAVETVLLDSVQSQANRLEGALLRAYDSGRIKMPLLQVNFAGDGNEPILAEVGRLTALEAPHRMCDAIFRDSLHCGVRFRESELGAKLNSAGATNATSVFALCPTALFLGFWDSTGPRGGAGTKLQRALVSEIVGYQAVTGKRTASRIDPLRIENNVDIFARPEGGWTCDEAQAARDQKGQPIKLKPSEINHGNITPSLRREDKTTGKQVLNHGGMTLAYALQHTVLSLAALRRLRFPLNNILRQETDDAARTVVAALALAAICFLDEDGYDLRSRCLLDGTPGNFEFVGRGERNPFTLSAAEAIQLLAEAAEEATHLGLPWPEEPITLEPSEDLKRLVVESRRRSMTTEIGA
ncbi:MAG TPA: type I-U CRISPR-associated RAMP protein Csb1/Cas7u [Bryobacteraceae bacterium]|jgi:CRISPR-associated protein Csb1|nr:type I-U CRISPR-associated RAMP protein Csb1/Cas7u [Bryobacteraceae bacterium]